MSKIDKKRSTEDVEKPQRSSGTKKCKNQKPECIGCLVTWLNAHHNTIVGNHISGVSSQVRPLAGKSYLATGLETAVFRGENHNTGVKDYGLYVEAHKHLLTGDLLLGGKMGINIGDREPRTWFEINGQPYISAANAGIIMKSDDTTCWQVRVDGSGQLFTTSVFCP